MNAERVKALARECGFDLVRITSAADMSVERRRYLDWIAAGGQADMSWITPERAERSSCPQSMLVEARAVISVAMSYWAGDKPPAEPARGRIARYAWGEDYHRILTERLGRLTDGLSAEFGGAHRSFVDTGPAMDKAFAARAGIGWYGKNTNILTERFGSFVLLGEVITSLPLSPDPMLERSCGSCRLCQVACPTGALDTAYTIESRRCISYLTIEHRGSIPHELRPLMSDWVFGCDICQDVCPPTREPHFGSPADRLAWVAEVRELISRRPNAIVAREPALGSSAPRMENHPLFPREARSSVDLCWLLRLTHEDYVEAFRGTAIKRAKVWMLRRNAAIALGNVGDGEVIPLLATALAEDVHPLVRGHAAWAIGAVGRRTAGVAAAETLRNALALEPDEGVRSEINLALAHCVQARS